MAKIITVGLTLKGEAPLLMHNVRGVNTFDPLAQQIAAITSSGSKKTEEDTLRLYRLEWEMGLYWSETLGPYIPGENIKRAIQEAAAAFRGAQKVKRGVQPLQAEIPLLYHGSRTLDDLWDAAHQAFSDIRPAKIPGSRGTVMRCRPRFDEWGLETSMLINTSVLDLKDFQRYVIQAGNITGLGDYRPRFGRFLSTLVILDTQEMDDTPMDIDEED